MYYIDEGDDDKERQYASTRANACMLLAGMHAVTSVSLCVHTPPLLEWNMLVNLKWDSLQTINNFSMAVYELVSIL